VLIDPSLFRKDNSKVLGLFFLGYGKWKAGERDRIALGFRIVQGKS
jgi:hypothetical protein